MCTPCRSIPRVSYSVRASCTPTPLVSRPGLSVSDDLLHLGVHLDHLLVQLRVIPPHDLRIPARGHEDGVDAARQRRREDVGDLEADEEREGDDEGRVLSVVVVRGVGEEQIQVAEQRTGVADEDGAKREDGPDEAVLCWSVQLD